MTNHLGKNPKKGGNPPNDNKFKNIKNFIKGFIIDKLKIWLKWNNLKLLNIKIIEIDKIEYKIKYVIHNNSLFIIAKSIHPKWLIEEKAINLRKEVWFNPPNAPIIIENKIVNRKKL